MRIALRGVAYSYPRPASGHDTPILRDVSFAMGAGETVGLMGREGAGKTTLLQLVAGLLRPDSGSLLVDGEAVWEDSSRERSARRRVGFAFQFPEQQFFRETVEDELLYAAGNFGMDASEARGRAARVMEVLGLSFEGMRGRSPFTLSLGEARRVAVASVLVTSPAVLLLDEPTAGLDGRGAAALLELLRLRSGPEMSALIVSHDAELLAECATRVLLLQEGRIAVDAPAAEFFRDPVAVRGHGLAVPEAVEVMEDLGALGRASRATRAEARRIYDEAGRPTLPLRPGR